MGCSLPAMRDTEQHDGTTRHSWASCDGQAERRHPQIVAIPTSQGESPLLYFPQSVKCSKVDLAS